jgi:ubiquinone/menaquinone biosynthesis C-methylase UbiE
MDSILPDTLGAASLNETQGFQAFHAFLRASRRHMETQVWKSAFEAHRQKVAQEGAPADWRQARARLDDDPAFQLYTWMFRNLQRFKYYHAQWGLYPSAERQRDEVTSALEESAARAIAEGRLRLSPSLALPAYYEQVDFHQHKGGVWSDQLDGLVYELGRRTTIPAHMDPNEIYRILFGSLPQDRAYERVLDWGTGHGAGLITWGAMHPESELHGVDLSAPCLKLANHRALEAGMRVHLQQADIAALPYPDQYFDALFFVFLLHEIPPGPMPKIYAEAARVLKPRGVLVGLEFAWVEDDAFAQGLMVNSQYANNEVFSPAFFKNDHEKLAKAAGFSRANIAPFAALEANLHGQRAADLPPPYQRWLRMEFQK